MNTDNIALQLTETLTKELPNRAALACVTYTLRDILKDTVETLIVYDREELLQTLDKIDSLTTSIRTLAATEAALQRLSSLIAAPATTEPEEV